MKMHLDELQWKSPEWIQTFGLHTDNVLDYFSESPFFDKTANNQVIKMQRQFAEPTATATYSDDWSHLDPLRREVLQRYPQHAQLERELAKLTGMEYVVAEVREPDFWVIKKQERGNTITTLMTYYVIGANVYQSPRVSDVLRGRAVSATLSLQRCLSDMQELLEFHPAQGLRWVAHPHSPTSPSNNPTSTVPNTNAQTVGATVSNTGASVSNTVSGPQISTETLDRLLNTSLRATPEYL